MANFPRIRSTFGVTPYNPERDTDEKRRAIFEHYQDQVSTQPMPDESMPWNVPFPPGVALQEEFDEMLQKRVVDPLSRAGYEDLGAGLASVPSAVHSMLVPQTEFDVAGTIIPLPNVAKAMKKGKFRKIRNAMKAEDPENVGEIIAKQAGKEAPVSSGVEGQKAGRDYEASGAKNARQKFHPVRDVPEKAMNPVDKFFMNYDDPKRSTIRQRYDELLKNDPNPNNPYSGKSIHNPIFNLDESPFPSNQVPRFDISPNTTHVGSLKEKIDKRSTPSKSVDPPKPPKGDPEASLRGPFQSIRSQLDVAPARMDERGRAFENIGQSDFMPYERPQVGQFEDVQKRNYVERDLDPKEKMWNEIVASDPYLPDRPEYLKNLRNYFDNRWEQAQGTAEGKMMQLDMPMSQRLKPKDEKSVTSGYIDELAFKRFAEPYDKTIQAERALAKKPGDKPVRTAIIDDKIQSYFGDDVKSPGRKLQDQMYPPKPKEPERFGKIKESLKAEPKKGSGSSWLDVWENIYGGTNIKPKGKFDAKSSFDFNDPANAKFIDEATKAVKKEKASANKLTKPKKIVGRYSGGNHLPKGTTIVHDGHMYRVTGHMGDDTEFEGIPWNDDLFDDAVTIPDDARRLTLDDDYDD